MRQIKFRGKSIKKKEWVYGYYFFNGNEHGIVTNTAYIGSWEEVDPATLGQFTGLLDKNGKEVYDRDIVPTKFGNREIFWDEKRFGFCYTMPIMGQSTEGIFNIYNLNDPEVIGNIHDNPSLLTNK